MSKQIVRTRIAPSPTGFPHIGTIYQVLFDYAYAKQHGGQFVLRIEDTDRARLVSGAEEVIYEALTWFGLQPDESPIQPGRVGPYRQSERLDIYAKHVQTLLKNNHAYYCFCTPERLVEMRQKQQLLKQAPMYDRFCLNLTSQEVNTKLDQKVPHVVRLKVPRDRKIAFDDLVAGHVEFDSNVIDDQVLLKSDGFPTYHLAVVVDDHLMHISHIFRGKEWISSTPKHVLLYEFFGWDMPAHGHLPLILNNDGKGKLSKRHGHASVDYYRQQGFLPEAVLNYLSNIVWHHPEEKEIYSLDEFIKLLDIKRVTSQGARFDLAKLEWMNGEYIRTKSTEELYPLVLPFIPVETNKELVMKLLPLARERMKKLTEFIHYLKPFTTYQQVQLEEKYRMLTADFANLLNTIQEWKTPQLEAAAKKHVLEYKLSMRDAFMALRLAVTGEKIGLPLFETFEILGKDEVMKRLRTTYT